MAADASPLLDPVAIAALVLAAVGVGAAALVIHAVRARLRLVQEALDTTQAAIAVYDRDDRLVIVNKRYHEVLGLPAAVFRRGTRYEDLVRLSLDRTLAGDALEREVQRRLELQRIADGRPSDRRYPGNRWLRVNKVRTRSGANVGIALDVTEYYDLKARLETEVRRFEALAASAPVGICQIDHADRILFANGSLLEMLGLSGLEDLGACAVSFETAGTTGSGFLDLVRLLRARGSESEVRLRIGPDVRDVLVRKALVLAGELESRVMPADRAASENILIFVDITERKRIEARIRFLAHHDPLTGACNRLAFGDELLAAAKAASVDRPASLIAIDLDRFKPVNDVYGHATGDELLRQIAGRISSALRPGMSLFRMGGDEFAVLLPPGVEARPVDFADALVSALCAPFQIDGHAILVGASAGVSSLPIDTDNPDALVHYADLALYHAKRAGGGAARAFDHAVLSSVDDRRRMELELVDAIESGALALAYQPVFAADRTRVVGAEVLARWRRAQTGEAVAPSVFIALAESSDLICRLDWHVFARAVRQFAAWSASGVRLESLLVNMSVRTFADAGTVRHVSEVLKRCYVPGRAIVIELTESFAVRNADAVSENMRAVNALGVRFAIDDFGTGYTSLRLVTQLPISFIKIDKSFVRELNRPDRSNVRHVVRAIADLTHNMGLHMIAEGVETDAELESLVAIGCHHFQGNLLSRPLPAEQIEALLERSAASQPAS